MTPCVHFVAPCHYSRLCKAVLYQEKGNKRKRLNCNWSLWTLHALHDLFTSVDVPICCGWKEKKIVVEKSKTQKPLAHAEMYRLKLWESKCTDIKRLRCHCKLLGTSCFLMHHQYHHPSSCPDVNRKSKMQSCKIQCHYDHMSCHLHGLGHTKQAILLRNPDWGSALLASPVLMCMQSMPQWCLCTVCKQVMAQCCLWHSDGTSQVVTEKLSDCNFQQQYNRMWW
jgi:hypothetical protein